MMTRMKPTPPTVTAPPPLRRLALVTYVHSEWDTDWGGELILYHAKKDARGNRVLEVAQCIAPATGIARPLCRAPVPSRVPGGCDGG